MMSGVGELTAGNSIAAPDACGCWRVVDRCSAPACARRAQMLLRNSQIHNTCDTSCDAERERYLQIAV
jgi:hypothetical protein